MTAAKDVARFNPGDRLTEREMQVLTGIAAGQSNAEIARSMFLGEQTVKTHIRRLFRKLGVLSWTAALTEGYRRGLLHGAMLMDADVLREAAEEIAAARAAYVEVFVARNAQARPGGHNQGDVDGWRTHALKWWNNHHPALCAFEREHTAHRGAVA